MKLLTYTVPVLILLLSFFYNTNPFIVKEEARLAYNYLDTAFRWNDSLTREAEVKALDMARRQQTRYTFADRNYYEFLLAGATNGQEAVQQLIAEKNFPHFASPAEIGIGYVKCDVGKHRSYTCIIIAKQH